MIVRGTSSQEAVIRCPLAHGSTAGSASSLASGKIRACCGAPPLLQYEMLGESGNEAPRSLSLQRQRDFHCICQQHLQQNASFSLCLAVQRRSIAGINILPLVFNAQANISVRCFRSLVGGPIHQAEPQCPMDLELTSLRKRTRTSKAVELPLSGLGFSA